MLRALRTHPDIALEDPAVEKKTVNVNFIMNNIYVCFLFIKSYSGNTPKKPSHKMLSLTKYTSNEVKQTR